MGENSDRSDSHDRSRGLVAIDSPSQGYEVENPKHHEHALQPRHSMGVHGQESHHRAGPGIRCAPERETRTHPRSAGDQRIPTPPGGAMDTGANLGVAGYDFGPAAR